MIAATDLSLYPAFPGLAFTAEPISQEFPASREGEGRRLPICCGRHGLVPSPCSSNFTETEESLELVSALPQAVYQLLVCRP